MVLTPGSPPLSAGNQIRLTGGLQNNQIVGSTNAMSNFFRILILVPAIALGGCASTGKPYPVLGLAKMTPERLSMEFEHEREHLNGKAPRIGLALSGGGTKAAIFAHGVLHGLQKSGVLKQVDVMSTVSGGSYAGFWYFTKLMEANRLKFQSDDIFADCLPAWWSRQTNEGGEPTTSLQKVFAEAIESAKTNGEAVCYEPEHLDDTGLDRFRWQAHLLRWPDVFRNRITDVTGSPQGSPLKDGLTTIPIGFLQGPVPHFLGNSIVLDRYEAGIERAWGLNPAPRPTDPGQSFSKSEDDSSIRYTNALGSAKAKAPRMDPERMSWNALKELYRASQSPPLWVMVANAGQKGAKPDMSNLYEMTPFGHGSPRMGWKIETPPVDSLVRGVRASAAFVDKQGAAWSKSVLTRLGLELDRFFAALRWGVPIETTNHVGEPTNLRLSDGGGVDNLGLVSLVRRGLQDIIVVDAGQDHAGDMEDICWAKLALKIDGLSMEFPNLERLADLCARRHPELQPTESAAVVENEVQLAYNVSDWFNPVVRGVIRDDATGQILSRLWLIKAAWNQNAGRRAYNRIANRTSNPQGEDCGYSPGQMSCLLLLYYGHNSKTLISKDDNRFMIFPQPSTPGQTWNSSSYGVLAFRELGKMIGSRLTYEESRGLGVKGDKECLQPVFLLKEKGRPGPGRNEIFNRDDRGPDGQDYC